jgi:uncharacterized protein YbcC (UPF0753/DUF2309 family)
LIKQSIENAAKIVPKYWPIGSFIHHNPLTAFEDQKFKDGLKSAQKIFGSHVYMSSEYYVDLYNKGEINHKIFEKNILEFLEKHKLEQHYEEAKHFLTQISSKLKYYKSYDRTSNIELDNDVFDYLKEKSSYKNYDYLFENLSKSLTLYEINDAIFDNNIKEMLEKDIIEYITRYLDEEQTTLSMHQRELGMFGAFKYFENFEYNGTSLEYVEEALKELGVKDDEKYILTQLLKLAGWSGFIKYRASNKEYYYESQYPTSIEDFLAIRLYYEKEYLSNSKINSFDAYKKYYENNKANTILRLLKYKGKLDNAHADMFEHHQDDEEILNSFITQEIKIDSLQLQAIYSEALNFDENIYEYHNFTNLLQEEQGYIWLKSVEDGHIESNIDALIAPHTIQEEKLTAAGVFCIDVRSEVIRRFVEKSGPYSTYGMAGFLGIPISFIEFDKGHEQFLCPGVIKPDNIVFELPEEEHKEYQEYKKQKGVLKTFKKVLSDLKNNPYSPFVMVEAVGWLFGIKLFGKTFFPRKVNKLFKSFKPKTPQTIYTIDKLSSHDVEKYSKKLHFKIIKEISYELGQKKFSDDEVENIWEHIILDKELKVEVCDTLLDTLNFDYYITKDDYELQKNKLNQVGFELEEQINHAHRILKTMGLTSDFPKFIMMISHTSISDNNPFESALDCGACGGNASLPNIRAFVMMINNQDVRDGLRLKGIDIPKEVKFVPATHNTTTDEIEFVDTYIIEEHEQEEFNKVKNDFNSASQLARKERLELLPNTTSEDDVFVKLMDWSETRPEWGLAKNNMCYVGDREATKNIDLHNKIFLQSYKWEEDSIEVDILTKLYDGPLVVGEWINMEHYFSTVDNDIYGAGSKVYHNVVSKIGVFDGNYSDLRIGLPSQTVMLENKAFHEPMRLIVFLEAPLEYGLAAVEKSPLGGQIILNEWIRLVVIDKKAKKVYQFENGEMQVIRELP